MCKFTFTYLLVVLVILSVEMLFLVLTRQSGVVPVNGYG